MNEKKPDHTMRIVLICSIIGVLCIGGFIAVFMLLVNPLSKPVKKAKTQAETVFGKAETSAASQKSEKEKIPTTEPASSAAPKTELQTTAAAGVTSGTGATAAETLAAGIQTAAAGTQTVPITASVQYAGNVSLNGLMRVVIRDTSQSSVVTQSGNYSNYAAQAFDDSETTSWQEGAAGNGIGESISANFDRSYGVSGILFKLGNYRTPKLWEENARPRTLNINLNGTVLTATFPNQMTQFAVILSAPIQTDRIAITVADVYGGSKYQDCAISDVQIYGN
jgi:hypothetical protein